MKNRISEIGLMTFVILFAVFAFLMQGRAHGEGPYEVKVGTILTEKYDMNGNIHELKRYDYEVAGILLYDKEAAYDLAYALNRAREERTKPKPEIKAYENWPRKEMRLEPEPCPMGDYRCYKATREEPTK